MLYETEHLRVQADDGTATLWLDFPGDSPNRLNVERIGAIGRALAVVLPNPAVGILVIRSAKPAGTCGGADPESLAEIADDAAARDYALAGQRVLSRLAAADCITLAVLEGPCLGPGLELALACDYRIAVAAPANAIGFSDLPLGWGGLTRAMRLLGAAATVELLARGQTFNAREARDLGLVDHAGCERRAKIDLRTFLDNLQRHPRKRRSRPSGLDGWFASRVAAAFRRTLPANVSPAIAGAVAAIPAAAQSATAGLAAERAAFAHVVRSAPVRAGLELLRSGRPQHAAIPRADLVALVGSTAGIGPVMAELAVRGQRLVHLPIVGDDDDASIELAFVRMLRDRRLTPLEIEQARGRVATIAEPGPHAAGLVFLTADTAAGTEAAEELAGRYGVIAAVGATAEWASRPDRIVGLAFSTVATPGPFAEVIRFAETTMDAARRVEAWLHGLGVSSVVVGDRPGQIVHRVLAAYYDEAVRLVADGVPIGVVDAAARRWGAQRGPLETLDGFGFPTAVRWVPRAAPLLAAGLRGRPHAEGFYLLRPDDAPCANVTAQAVLCTAAKGTTPVEFDEAHAATLAMERLTLRALNEAVAVLAEDAQAGPAEIDRAIVRGAGLFAVHGGPLRYADITGLTVVGHRLKRLTKTWGKRFQPRPELSRRALAGERFHTPSEPRDSRPRNRAA